MRLFGIDEKDFIGEIEIEGQLIPSAIICHPEYGPLRVVSILYGQNLPTTTYQPVLLVGTPGKKYFDASIQAALEKCANKLCENDATDH